MRTGHGVSLLYPQGLAQPGSKAPPHKDLLKVQKGRRMQGMNAQLVLDKRNGDRLTEGTREGERGGKTWEGEAAAPTF